MKIFIILLIVVVLLSMPSKNQPDEIKDGLKEVARVYGKQRAAIVESIFRKETAHFTSGQFKQCKSPGMEKHAKEFPYGWTVLKDFWNSQAKYKPVGFFTTPENKTGITKTFIKFPTVTAGMMSLARYLDKYPPGRWFSTDPAKAAQYEKELLTVIPRYTNTLT